MQVVTLNKPVRAVVSPLPVASALVLCGMPVQHTHARSVFQRLASFWRETKDPEGVQQDSQAQALGSRAKLRKALKGRRREFDLNSR